MKIADLGNCQVSYQDKGEGPAILFGHSYLWDSHMWDEITENLSKSYRCIVPDLVGHGNSSNLESIDLDQMADIHGRLMDYLNIKSYSLAGLSIGAMWGSLLVAKNKNIEKFAVLNSSLSPEPPEKLALYESMLSAVDAAACMPPPILDAVVPGFFSKYVDLGLVRNFRNSLADIPSERIPCVTACGRAFLNRGNLLTNLSDRDIDTFIIAAQQDAYRSIGEAKAIKDALNGKMLLVNSGHISVKEKPREISEILLEFFGKA
jgi:pimeloyl-ACP methyl ester carboxylesterase